MMNTRFKNLANPLAATLQLFSIHWFLSTANAAVPVVWTNTPAATQPYPVKPVPHGSTVDFAVTLRGYTSPPIESGADVRLWFQTNGMGSAWWSAPATFDGSTITATFGPAQDCGADRVSLFFGAPSNVFASAVLRLTHAPGFTPATLPIPVPTLDFAGLEVLNAPYYTQAETDARIVELSPAAQPPGNYLAVSNAAMSAAAQTNDFLRLTGGTMRAGAGIEFDYGGDGGVVIYPYNPAALSFTSTYSALCDVYATLDLLRVPVNEQGYGQADIAYVSDITSATNALAVSTASALGSYLPLSGGILTGDLSLSGAASIQYTGVWYVRMYANVGEAGNRIYTNEGDTWQSERGLAWIDETTNHVHAAAVAATNYTDSSISSTNPAFAAAVRNVPITGADSSDLAEIAEYGSYGTVGAAILALIAGLAALKRGKLDKSAVIDPSLATIADLGQAADALAVQGLVANINDSIDEATHYAVHIIEAGDDGYQLEDIVDNVIQVGGPEFDGAISLLMPPAVEGRIRDFLVEVDNDGSIAAEIEIPEWDETVAIGWANDDDIEEMLTVEPGTMARFYFSERGVRFVAGTDPQSGEPIELPLIVIRRLDVVSEQV